MNKQELIERMKGFKKIFGNKIEYIELDLAIELASELDEPEAGHADEAPRYVKNILARLRELPLHDREVWLKAIMGEFERDFSLAKWREGYEQGKVEGFIEREKVTVPQFVADWYEENKHDLEYNLWNYIMDWDEIEDDEFKKWFNHSSEAFQTLVNMHQFGYTVEKEKRYLVKMKGVTDQTRTLKRNIDFETWYFGNPNNYEDVNAHHTRKELEEAGFGWVFDCEGIEIEEVTE